MTDSTNQQWISMYNQQLDQMQQQWSTPNLTIQQPVVSVSPNFTYTTTGDAPSYRREYEVSRIVKRSKGYFYVISVDATDDVFFRVWKVGMFPYMIAKMFKRFGRDIDGNRESWNSVTKRTHLPATLGSAYEKVDEAIKEDIGNLEHDRYVKDMLKTDPENLKMIGGLERLQEGDVDGPEEDLNVGTSHSVGGVYSNQLAVTSGNSVYTGPGATITFDTPEVKMGDLSAGEVTADKIILNGTDLEEKIVDTVRDATELLKAEVLAKEETVANAP